MSVPVETQYSIEIEVTLTGSYVPYVPASGPSYASGGEPADGDYCEDIGVDGVWFERIARKLIGGNSEKGREYEITRTRIDILQGLADAAKAIVRANILAAIGEDTANEELRQEAVG